MKIISLFIVVILFCGCSIHYINEKGMRADASDIETRAGSIEEANAYFWSRCEVWIPFRPKNIKEDL